MKRTRTKKKQPTPVPHHVHLLEHLVVNPGHDPDHVHTLDHVLRLVPQPNRSHVLDRDRQILRLAPARGQDHQSLSQDRDRLRDHVPDRLLSRNLNQDQGRGQPQEARLEALARRVGAEAAVVVVVEAKADLRANNRRTIHKIGRKAARQWIV